MGRLDETPDTRAGWSMDATALVALSKCLARDEFPEWCNPEWLMELSKKIERHAETLPE